MVEVMVKVGGGGNVSVSNKLVSGTINLNWNRFHNELLPFELNKFNVILGKDWLEENLKNILCGRKMVRTSPPRREPFIVYGDKSRVKYEIISLMKTKRCLNKGCTTFLAYMIDVKNEKKEMTEIPVMCDFLDVFPDDLP
ncbi:uncharacterized protein LOC111895982 [Lactuca sativa]|uniref:uncharacterized protein LOC111895982 n=1 Tax=Lactuca sativa TaxID=4236 RepID=UPI000CD7ECC0|nr:uncharacterized protein LOC111895982 [Lactuca sativa]